MVGPPLAPEEEQGQQEGEDLRRGNGPPDAVHIQQQRQDQHGAGLEHHSPQEGDNGGGEAVVEGRKEGGGEDVEARQQEGEGEEPEGVGGEGEERRVISHEEAGQGRGSRTWICSCCNRDWKPCRPDFTGNRKYQHDRQRSQ